MSEQKQELEFNIPSPLKWRLSNSRIAEDTNWRLYTGYCLNACMERKSPISFEEWMNWTSPKNEGG
ncbi:hypothetical protein ACFSR7_05890 [Cohnella sp. GCM10020058]|uniref:hypothetical protein n=1 Tax=Cohnella sp. GCM10020058 TaxID=3317330 RepID=UPI0036405FFA